MSDKPPPSPSLKPPVTPQDWESLFDDFQQGGVRLHKWTAASSSPLSSLLDHALSSLIKKDFPLKIPLLIFLEEFSQSLLTNESQLDSLLDALRAVIQAPIDGIAITFNLKEQFMISTTSIFISIDALNKFPARYTEGLIELLLNVIHRPNHGLDRQTRAIACECLREIEKCYPCLLSSVASHLWSLCQSERTHACQSYILLFTMVVYNIVNRKLNISILNTSSPLVPFNLPHWVFNSSSNDVSSSGLNYKELRRALAFLLDTKQVLSPCGMVEFLQMIMPMAVALELQGSMLKIQFFGMIYSYDPLLCHIVLVMYSHLLDTFDGQEGEIVKRLMLISKETQHSLVFRLLALHWLLGFLSKLILSKEGKKYKSVAEICLRFYPAVFDSLGLKALKLDLLAFCSIYVDSLRIEGSSGHEGGAGNFVVKLFEDGLVSVSAFKWLSPWSSETAVAFRAFHKFLIGSSSHSDADPSSTRNLMNSVIFHKLQGMLVAMTLDFVRLVPVVVSFVERLLSCKKHQWLGERLLQMVDEHLLPKVKINYKLGSYFPIFDRIAENNAIPPRRLLDLLTKFMVFLVEKHGPDTGLRSWSQGSKVLSICRTMLMYHRSSRLFVGLSHLLAYTCLYFPDLEVRDNARIYLRMLICVPGMKLKGIMNFGEQFLGISPSTNSSSFFNVVSPRRYQNFKKSRSISSCIHLERVLPLLVKLSWSLSLSPLDNRSSEPSYLGSIMDNEPHVDSRELDVDANFLEASTNERTTQLHEPLRVMDSNISQILGVLRRHFSCIPDFRHMPGLKVSISCSLRFESDPFKQLFGISSPTSGLDGIEALPALYATVLKFSSSAPYGSIPPSHIPFLLGEPTKNDQNSDPEVSLDIVPVENCSEEEENYRAPVKVILEPREPTPGLVDVFIETNVDNGQIIRGQLQSITIGIEDMFLKAIVPSEISENAISAYYSGLFEALWEACGASSNLGRETFPLKGGKGTAAINGTRSVKLLEVPAESLIHAIDHYLAPFVVSVIGEQLVNMVKDRGIIKDIIWKTDTSFDSKALVTMESDRVQLHLTCEEDEKDIQANGYKRNIGSYHVLIFLPPRFHLLFQMEVSEFSMLVRIRTDHWPCLAYVDDFLEALFLTESHKIFPFHPKAAELSSPMGDQQTVTALKHPFSDRVPIRSIVCRPDKGTALSGQRIRVGGWVKTGREQGKGSFAFLELNDGSCAANLQVIVEKEVADLSPLVHTGACVSVEGVLTEPPEGKGTKQQIELRVEKVLHVGPVDPAKYPIPKTKLTLEFLRDRIHFRPRTNTISAVARIRNALAFATHSFFQEHGFLYIHTPIITTSDCEGAGEMFQVTTLISEIEKIEKELIQNPPPSEAEIEAAKLVAKGKGEAVANLKAAKASKAEITTSVAELTAAKENVSKLVERSKLKPGIPKKDGNIDYSLDFFSRQAFLTVSGQLQVETYACAVSNVYTFGPTFRAENSHTSRHLAEFWMVEPEIAFADLQDDMNCAEAYVKYMCQWLLDKCLDDMELMEKLYDKTCIERLRHVASTPFERVSYTEAVQLLEKAVQGGKQFENKVEWGIDLASEHERYLTEVLFQKPVIVYNYPKGIKAFYMRLNDDSKTVAAMDVLVPKVGELIGGSQREERLEVIQKRIAEMGLPSEPYEWYLDLRRFGTVKHSGFGLGFERMILFATGMDNIRDVIPFPRYPGRADL